MCSFIIMAYTAKISKAMGWTSFSSISVGGRPLPLIWPWNHMFVVIYEFESRVYALFLDSNNINRTLLISSGAIVRCRKTQDGTATDLPP